MAALLNVRTLQSLDFDAYNLLNAEARAYIQEIEQTAQSEQTDIEHSRTKCTVCGECSVCNLRPCSRLGRLINEGQHTPAIDPATDGREVNIIRRAHVNSFADWQSSDFSL